MTEAMADVMTNQCSIISTVDAGEGHHQTWTLRFLRVSSEEFLFSQVQKLSSDAAVAEVGILLPRELSLNLSLGLTDDLSSFDLDILPVFG